MPLWKVKLLKMNQQCVYPRPWEEDEGSSYRFPEYLGVVPRGLAAETAGTEVFGSFRDGRTCITHLSWGWRPVTQ